MKKHDLINGLNIIKEYNLILTYDKMGWSIYLNKFNYLNNNPLVTASDFLQAIQMVKLLMRVE